MKKKMGVILVVFSFFVGILQASAVCEASEKNELNSVATNVRASYEVAKVEISPNENFNTPDGLSLEELQSYTYHRNVYRIYITNITKELYVEVVDNIDTSVRKYTYQDATDGTIQFDQKMGDDVRNYTIKVYASGETNCIGETLQTLTLTTPRYNGYSEYEVCNGIEDFYLCHPYLTVSVSFDNFFEQVEKYKQGKINQNGDDVTEVKEEEKKNNLGVIIGTTLGVILLGGAAGVIIVTIKRRKNYEKGV